MFNENMEILQLGDGLARLCQRWSVAQSSTGLVNMNDLFTMIHPMMAITYTNVRHFMNAVFLLQMKVKTAVNEDECLVLKGLFIHKL